MMDIGSLGQIAAVLRLEQDYVALRYRLISAQFASETAWNMLIDLRAAEIEGQAISVSSACIASGGAATTALRHITRMVANGDLLRLPDRRDRRLGYLRLSSHIRESIDAYAKRAARLRPRPTIVADAAPIRPTDALAAIGQILARVG